VLDCAQNPQYQPPLPTSINYLLIAEIVTMLAVQAATKPSVDAAGSSIQSLGKNQ